jgi:hypothetical protein
MKFGFTFTQLAFASVLALSSMAWSQSSEKPGSAGNSDLTAGKSNRFTPPVIFNDWQKIRCIEMDNKAAQNECMKSLPPRYERYNTWLAAKSRNKLDSLEMFQLNNPVVQNQSTQAPVQASTPVNAPAVQVPSQDTVGAKK